jgi:hypothetical protein
MTPEFIDTDALRKLVREMRHEADTYYLGSEAAYAIHAYADGIERVITGNEEAA